MRPVFLLVLGSISALAQPFTAGIKAGVPLTDFVNSVESGPSTYTSSTHRYIVGGTAELHLPLSLSVEFDAMYRSFQYNGSGNLVDVLTTSHTTGSQWEFPLLLKYRFHFPVVRPYVDGGVAWNTLTGLKQTVTQTGPLEGTTASGTPTELQHSTTAGFVLGGGIDIHAVVLHISPELRFTRWNSAQLSALNGAFHSNQNQAELLVGFTF
ncbi:MAG: outer membrane beta-barrel protein [Bryobacteraceae bacterium]|jgi:hypothetical protein